MQCVNYESRFYGNSVVPCLPCHNSGIPVNFRMNSNIHLNRPQCGNEWLSEFLRDFTMKPNYINAATQKYAKCNLIKEQ